MKTFNIKEFPFGWTKMRLLIVFVLLVAIEQTVESVPAPTKKLSPIILVPGIGNNILEAKIHNNTAKGVEKCRFNGENWFELWAHPFYFLYNPQCFVEIFSLSFDSKTRTTSNSEGVDTRTTDFGNTTSVEYFSSVKLPFARYFADLVEHLVNTFGYERGVSIHGAPYDFRKAPNEQKTFYADLKQLIENTYSNNNKSRVILLGHSLGSLYIHHFLNKQDQSWKKTYVRSFISTSSPYGGCLKPLRVFASGDNLGNDQVNGSLLKEAMRTMTSNSFLIPYNTYWNGTEILVYGPNRNYTVNCYKQFFKDIGFPIGFEMRKSVVERLKAPDVEMHCVYGSSVPTTEQLVYKNWTTPDQEIKGEGDGTVNLRSLRGCRRFEEGNSGGFHEYLVGKSSAEPPNHVQIISNNEYFAIIDGIVKPE